MKVKLRQWRMIEEKNDVGMPTKKNVRVNDGRGDTERRKLP